MDKKRGTGGYYVSVQRRDVYTPLLGPYDTHDEALSRVRLGIVVALRVDPTTVFDAFGTMRIIDPAKRRPGVLNHLSTVQEFEAMQSEMRTRCPN